MVTTTNNKKITEEAYYALEQSLVDKGYIAGEYFPTGTYRETDVLCPCCDENVVLYLVGSSYQISCKTDNCLQITFRGI